MGQESWVKKKEVAVAKIRGSGEWPLESQKRASGRIGITTLGADFDDNSVPQLSS